MTRAPHTEPKPPGGEGPAARAAGPLRPARAAARARATGPHGVPPTTARTAPATITAAGPRKPAVGEPGPAGVTATRPRGSAARGRPTVLPRRGGAVDEAECPLAVYRR